MTEKNTQYIHIPHKNDWWEIVKGKRKEYLPEEYPATRQALVEQNLENAINWQ